LLGIAALLILSVQVVGCGGGSEELIPERIPPIQVSANVDTSVDEQTQIDIEGAAIGGQGALSYAWQADDTITIVHADTSQANATLTTPIVTVDTQFTIRLVVTDERQVSSEDTFTLTVTPVNLPPVADISINSLPDYPQGSYPVQSQVILDAGASSDADAPSEQPQIAAYQWRQIAGTLLTPNGNLTSSRLELTTPITDQQETIIFELEVTDQEGTSTITQTQITLLGQSGTLPELHFNTMQNGFSGERLLLDMTASSAAPDAGPYSYFWQERSGNFPSLQIEDNTQAITYITLPTVEQTTELIIDAQITDSFDNTVRSEKRIIIEPFQPGQLNDTGAQESFDTRVIPGSDIDFGRDIAFSNDVVTKVGRGLNAFDFTRLNSNGDPVDTPTTSWSCVRDNVTGLVWQIKTTDNSSLHYENQLFTWYQADLNGNFRGERNLNSMSCNINSQECNTQSYLNEVNRQGLCGFFDWRIPTHAELQSIVHYGKMDAPLVDTEFLPFWGNDAEGLLWYWTRQSSADGLRADEARNAWAIDFNSGVDNVLSKSSEAKLRLVRAGRLQLEN